jgi:2-iminobutanoate/2-iminopropanoate deaminase
VIAGDLVLTSGQIPLDPSSGKLIDGDIAAQTQQVMANLSAVLRAAGSSLERVVRSTIYVTDLGDFQTINAVYGSYFVGFRPARSTVQVAALPLGARVEIDMIAMR